MPPLTASSRMAGNRKNMKTRTSWNVTVSKFANDTVNPIRTIVENMTLNPNPEKGMISLSIGDPTVFGNLKTTVEIAEAVVESVRSFKYNGYAPSTGHEEARRAVAEYSSVPGAEVTAKDVILTSGCSQALDFCICVLANPGQNILIPRPGFPLSRTLAEGLGIEIKHYDLVPERSWEVDLADLESQIDSKTAAIVVNNPSNPCGSVFLRSHLNAILAIAARNYVPIIADEIYEHFVFEGEEFIPMASLTTEVPILTCGGLTKRFLVPGWRLGWVLIHDRHQTFGSAVRNGLQALSQRIMGSNTLIQGAVPTILKETPQSFFHDTIKIVQDNARIAYSALSSVPGLTPIMPAGAMYMMVAIDMSCFPHLKHDKKFVEALIAEQSVFCLPGMCFDYPGYIRIVLTLPEEQLIEACERIEEFCQSHYLTSSSHHTEVLAKQVIMPV